MEQNKLLYRIHIKGVVQGVGFRPFVYRTAQKNHISGYVCNLGNMVEIMAAGECSHVESFLKDIYTQIPPLARIDSLVSEPVDIEDCLRAGFDSRFLNDFCIVPSREGSGSDSILPQDTAVCKDCLREMRNPEDRHFMYPFTVCTNCGPRYTTVRALPYDRQNTSMDDFPMCTDCFSEYVNPEDRRYHAQAACCPLCGPAIRYCRSASEIECFSKKEKDFVTEFDAVAQSIADGRIIAVKGYGGFHLVCNAADTSAVSLLRKRLNRPYQPFALMVRGMKTAQQIVHMTLKDARLLQNQRRPILVLNKKNVFESIFSEKVSPDLHNIGLMLPYSGTHYLLFEALSRLPGPKIDCLVMTSANLPGRPMVIDNKEAFERLNEIADGFFIDNRIIENRTDDTVVRNVCSDHLFLRRSRGFVPERILLPFSSDFGVVGVGAEMNNTISFCKNGLVYLSQYIGNTKHTQTNDYHIKTLNTLKNLSGISPDLWVCDMHPAFNTTKTAEYMAHRTESRIAEKNRLLRIQHHHAHICSGMADNMLEQDSCVLGISLDGVGFGPDRTVWGGEVLKCTYTDFERLSHLRQQPMPGGDLAAYFPSRMVYGCLFKNLSDSKDIKRLLSCKSLFFRHGEAEKRIVLSQLNQHTNQEQNLIMTSSAGRILDSVSAILGLCQERTYEGEPAMRLESAAYFGRLYGHPKDGFLRPEFMKQNGLPVFDTSAFLESVFNLFTDHAKRTRHFSVFEIAAMAESCFSEGVCSLAADASSHTGIKTVVLSGGVFNNDFITSTITKKLTQNGLTVLRHKNLPTGDGCISHGQAVIGTASVLSGKV